MSLVSLRRAGVANSGNFKARYSYTLMTLATRPTITVARSLRSPAVQGRSLWWWSRQGNEWSSYLDEHLQNRIQREQKIMRYRYSKFLRRRAMWDREASETHVGWQGRWMRRRFTDTEGLASQQSLKAKVSGQPEDDRLYTRPMENQYSEDFAKFRASLDKDPFTAVLGQRLERPSTSNNSAWTSLAWIFEPAKQPSATGASSKPVATRSQTRTDQHAQKTPVNISQGAFTYSDSNPDLFGHQKAFVPVVEEEYVFDPISMKKVPKTTLATPTPPLTKKAPLISSLFAEHGVDIPIKTYEPHKVHGYTGKDTTQSRSEREAEVEKAIMDKAESFRMQEMRRLKAAKLGNAIDATNFCSKYQAKEAGVTSEHPQQVEHSALQASEDDAPLFSGTTYESKSHTIFDAGSALKSPAQKAWLTKEGFGAATVTAKRDKGVTNTAERSKIEPSLDRMSSSNKTGGPPKIIAIDGLEKDKAEDLDLLRASDVRASTKSARKTRVEAEYGKQETRTRLEADYAARRVDKDEQHATFPEAVAASSQKLQDNLNNLWQRIRDQPQYVNLANTIKKMGAFQDAYKNYGREKKAADPNAKLVFKDETLSKTPSIYKKSAKLSRTPIDTFTPSKEVLDAERESHRRTFDLKQSTEFSKKQAAKQKVQATELAGEIRAAYEQQYGPIDINHRQGAAESKTSIPEQSDIARNLMAHAQHELRENFWKEYGRLWNEARDTRRHLHEISLHVRAIKEGRPPTFWNALKTDVSSNAFPTATAGGSWAQQLLPPSRLSNDHDLQDSAAKEVMDYTMSVVTANKAAARAQAVLELRARRTNQVQALEKATVEAKPNTLAMQDDVKAKRTREEQLADATRARRFLLPRMKSSLESTSVVPVVSAPATPDNPSPAAPIPSESKILAAGKIVALYKILAYDSSTLQISIADTTSSLSASPSSNGNVDTPLHPTEVLSRLNNPAKFLPYFQGLQDQGYEIVSGSGDILVFKKFRDAVAGTVTESAQQGSTETLPSAEKSTPQEAATVIDEVPARPARAPAAPTTSPVVRRQEDVFSGSGQTWHQEQEQSPNPSSSSAGKPSEGVWSRVRRGVRRVFFTGLATAGVAYAIGAVAESFGAQQPPVEVEENRKKGRPGIYSTESSR